MTVEILQGDCRDSMALCIEEGSVQCVVTSPPYFGLRDYGVEGQIGLEESPAEYVEKIVAVFREVRRVLRGDGTVWLNLGDSYAGSGRGGNTGGSSTLEGSTKSQEKAREAKDVSDHQRKNCPTTRGSRLPAGLHAEAAAAAGAIGRAWVPPPAGLKNKDLIGIPWRVAFALQADGWYLRQDIIWHKPNPMPESIKDRCTKAHEYIFLLAKSELYFLDNAGLQEPAVEPGGPHNKRPARGVGSSEHLRTRGGVHAIGPRETRNKRSVWTITTKPFKGAHFATFPPDLIEPCILAGSKPGDLVLDPFGGAGTTALVARKHGRRAVLCELNPAYIALTQQRLAKAAA